MPKLILVVEDEQDLVDNLVFNLGREGYKTRCANNLADAKAAAFRSPPPDLILLDIMLPDGSGTELCRLLRADPRTSHVGIIMLTAKDSEIDRVVGFELGADDYVVKPFSVRELMLRVKALTRRTAPPAGGASESEAVFGVLRLDVGAHRVWVAGEELSLTALEFRLLRLLLERRGRVQSRQALLEAVWGIDAELTTRTVDTHVKRLRHKLGSAAAYIETVRGVGYRLKRHPHGDTE